MDKQRIVVSNAEERQTVAAILIKNGYTVRVVKERVGKSSVASIEYWRDRE